LISEMANKSFSHDSVLLDEAVCALVRKNNGVYVDGTFGRGGHSKKILEKLGPGGRLIAIDKDLEAVHCAQVIQQQDPRFSICHGSFADIEKLVAEEGLSGKVDGVLMDLGLSSPQLDDAQRGFSFMREGPLDMRMNATKGLSAQEWLANESEEKLAEVIKTFGEERFAKRIANAIVSSREKQRIETTTQLAEIVSQAIPRWEKHKHPATRTFQAIRIFINRELDDLSESLEQVINVLSPGGRLVVISFHSLEDRIVKNYIKKLAKGDDIPSYIPVKKDQLNKRLKIIGKAVKPTEEEIGENTRARSAIMRVAEKL